MSNKQEASYEFNTDLSSLDGTFWDTYFHNVSPQTVKKWLQNPMEFNEQIRVMSRRLYNQNGVYTNTIDYMVAMPTLDRVIHHSKGSKKKKEETKKLFEETLDMIKDKEVVRDGLHKNGIDGVFFGYFETTEANSLPAYLSDYEVDQIVEVNQNFNCSVIHLPTEYCRIVGRKNSSYVISFNMGYFDQFTGNGRSLRLKRYPKEIREKYRAYRKDLNKKWAVLNNDKTIVTKTRARIEERWGRPLGLASYIDMLYDEYFTDTKRNKLDEINNNIVYQTFPEGEKKGTSSLTQTQQKQQHDNIKGALFNRRNVHGTSFFSVAAGTKLDKIKTEIDILNTNSEGELLNRISTNLGFAGSALNGQNGNYSSGQTNIEMVAAEIFSWIEQFQDELNKVINKNVIKDKSNFVKVYYLPITYLNREKMFKYMKDLYTQGRGSLQAWIASTGFSPSAYLALMDEELELGFDEKYLPHLTSYTATGEDVGRPQSPNAQNENTIKAKTNNNDVRPS